MIAVTEAAARAVGYTPAQMVGRCIELIAPSSVPWVRVMERWSGVGSYIGTRELLHKDGRRLPSRGRISFDTENQRATILFEMIADRRRQPRKSAGGAICMPRSAG